MSAQQIIALQISLSGIAITSTNPPSVIIRWSHHFTWKESSKKSIPDEKKIRSLAPQPPLIALPKLLRWMSRSSNKCPVTLRDLFWHEHKANSLFSGGQMIKIRHKLRQISCSDVFSKSRERFELCRRCATR